jgi:hypothetical protein
MLVNWVISAASEQLLRLQQHNWLDEVVGWLRSEFGQAKPALWTLGIDLNATKPMPARLFEEDSIRGDFLRALRDFQSDTSRGIHLGGFLGEAAHEEAMLSAVQIDSARRVELLNEVGMFGVKQLSGSDSYC